MLSLLIPKNIQIEWGSNFIQVSGPLGSIRKKKVEFLLAKENSRLFLSVNNSNENKNIEHFYLSMIKSYIIGVSKGYIKKLRLVGVGYKAHISLTNTLILKIGYNHEVLFSIPEDIKEKRLQRFMETQARISHKKLQAKAGQILTVLVDSHEGDYAISRSMADAPDIDGKVYLRDGKLLKPGDFVDVKIESYDQHDLFAGPNV